MYVYMYVYMCMYVCVYVSELVVITSSSVSLVFTLDMSFQNKEENISVFVSTNSSTTTNAY